MKSRPTTLEAQADGDNAVNTGNFVNTSDKHFTKAQELRSFLFLSVVMAPVLAVIVVAGYGFLVWMFQLLAGPPGS